MIKKTFEYPHRSSAVLGLLILFSPILLSAVVVIITLRASGTQTRASSSTPLLDQQDVVVLSEKKICSFVGSNQTSVHIKGEDGGASTNIGNDSYFVFGDTTLDVSPSIITNNAAKTTDTDASNCFDMTSKSAGVATRTVGWGRPQAYAFFVDSGGKQSNCSSTALSCSTPSYTYWPGSSLITNVKANGSTGPNLVDDNSATADNNGRGTEDWDWDYDVIWCEVLDSSTTSCYANPTVKTANVDNSTSSSPSFTIGNLKPNQYYAYQIEVDGASENSEIVNANFKSVDCGSGCSASETLPKISGESYVWPTDIVAAPDNQLHFFFASLDSSIQVTHIGLAKMDPGALDSTRVIPVFFQGQDPQIPKYKLNGASLTRQGNDVYVFFGAVDSGNKEATLLAKVSAANIANKSAYTYWDGSTFQADPNKMVRLWDQGPIGTHGMTIRYNSYLGKWTAIYNTGYVSEMSIRTAPAVTGPWSGEAQLINCLDHFALGSRGTDFPCYGGKEHPQFQKNNGQTIYVSHSNTVLYQPYLHEIVLGKAINQFVDSGGNALYRKDDSVSGFSKEGTAFYASEFAISGYVGIHDWVSGSEHILGATSPGAGYSDSGVVFYAPTSPAWDLAPIYRWDMGTKHRYSALDLSVYGYTRGAVVFWAKITQYRVTDNKKFDQLGSNFQIGVKKDNNWVSGASVTSATFSGLTPSTNYSIVTNTPFTGNRFYGQNITANGQGSINNSGNLSYVNILDLGVFAGNQALNTTGDLFTYWVRHTGVVDNPAEIGHQLNPYSRAPNFKNFLLTGTASGTYEGVVCKPDCASSTSWSGPVQFCETSVTLSPTGPTKCAKLSGFSLSGLAANTNYDMYYCMPTCADSALRVVYPKTSDGSGVLKYEESVADADGDGCIDSKELGSNWKFGGQRDPSNPWDFYDVPAPALKAGVTASKNKAVSLQDVLAVQAFFGTRDNGPANAAGYDYDSDFNGNGVEDGREYDRTPSTDPAKLWRSGSPNGSVSLQDVAVAQAQFGTNCN